MNKFRRVLEYVSEVPPSSKPVADKTQDKLTDLLVIVLLFGFAMWWRTIVDAWFSDNISDGFVIVLSEASWLTDIFGISLDEDTAVTIPVEGYGDTGYYYIPYVLNFALGWNPYSGSKIVGDSLNGYVYGPYYVLLISFGYLFQGMSVYESIMFSNYFFDSLTSVMIYVLAKRFTGNLNAVIFGFVYNFSPIVLYYFDIRLLNTPQMSFFALVAIWCFLEHRDSLSVFFFTFAALIKQFPLLFLLPVFLLLFRRYGGIKGFTFFLRFIIFFLVLSFPYILLTPILYLGRLFVGGRGKVELITLAEARARNGEATNLSFSYLLFPEGEIWKALFQLPVFYAVNFHVLFILGVVLLSWFAFSNYRHLEKHPHLYLRFFAVFQFVVHATIARGIFKYYTAFLVPFLLLAFIPYKKHRSFNLHLGKSLKSSFETILDRRHRYAKPTVSYWFHFICVLGSLVGCLIVGYWGISLFTERDNPQRILFMIFFCVFMILAIITSDSGSKQDALKFSKDPVILNDSSRHLPSSTHASTLKQQRRIKHSEQLTPEKLDTLSQANVSIFQRAKGSFKNSMTFIFVFDLLIWVISIVLLISLYLLITISVSLDFTNVFSSFTLIFIAIISMVPALREISRCDARKRLFFLFLSLCFFLLIRLLVFNDEAQFSSLIIQMFNLGQILQFMLSAVYGIILTGLLFLGSRQFRVYKEKLHSGERQIANESLRAKLREFYNFTLLLVIFVCAQYLIHSFAGFYFGQSSENYTWFILGSLFIMSSFWFLNEVKNTVSKQRQIRLVQIEADRFLLDFSLIIIALTVFWFFNIWVLTIDRLLTSALVAIFAIVLLGMMGSEFWKNGYSYAKFCKKTLRSLLRETGLG